MLLGYAADQLLGDPGRHHPVAGFGTLATRLEGRTWAPRRSAGVAHEAVLVGSTVAVALGLGRLPRPVQPVLVAAATWAVLGGRSLDREARAVGTLLADGDLEGARQRVRNLVGRDPWSLDADGVARATVESVAENCADAVVAPLLWGAVAGLPGLLGYRAVNTLDAMVGHRTARYHEFGWAAARLDDAANWLPARATVGITALVAAARERSWTAADRVVATVRRDAGQHPSPNAGPVEAAWAAALGVRLGGSNVYDGSAEDRGILGSGPHVTARDIVPASALLRQVGLASALTAVGLRLALRDRRRRQRH
ncbi:cobalamin biosynthesis protein CobD [Nostocoides sp. HKS02]|nr:cobalamin biosynthesis protein CobD [Tetrasphaera sp. HKS02]